jgi:zinc transport system permease protein
MMQLILSLFSSELAAATGVNVGRLDLYFLLVFSATVLLGLRFLGALLVGALIIVPAAIGRQLTHTLKAFLSASAGASVLSVVIGMLINQYYPRLTFGTVNINLALGPTVISVATFLFVLSLLRRKV